MSNDKYVIINKRSIAQAIQTGVLPMQRNYDSSHDYLPYFWNSVTPERYKNAHHESYSMSHIPGRWLDALLNAENLLQIPVDETCVSALRRWTYRSYEEQHLGFPAMLDLDTFQTIPHIDLHNLRETMHALVALVSFREDEKAFEHAQELVHNVERYFNPDNCAFRYEAFRQDTGADERYYGALKKHGATALSYMGMDSNLSPQDAKEQAGIVLFARTFGRYIGPLVKLYRATGYEPALNQAIKLQQACFTHVLPPDGSYAPQILGAHTHSVTSMISSLAQLSELLDERTIIQRVKAFVENGLNEIALDSGWCTENAHRRDWIGEINNTSDIMETCLILGDFGFEGYYARAERILRAHLLPAQVQDTGFIDDCPETSEASTSRMAWRVYGAFGFPTPTGHQHEPDGKISFNWDITGGAVSGLCKAFRHCITNHGLEGASVNLLFDCETDALSVVNPYDNNGVLTISIHQNQPVRIRIPGNTDTASIQVEGCQSHIHGEWLHLENAQAPCRILIKFPMQEKQRTYTFRGKSIDLLWQGEEVIAATNQGRSLCFFQDIY